MRSMRWAVGFGLVWAGGCSGSVTSDQTGQPPVQPALLTRRDAEPAGKNCPHGGTAIRAGLDRNGDGMLEDAEVDHTEYLCDVPTTVLARKDPLAPSLECPDGGIAVQTGIDDNSDGILEDAEIDQTTHVCNSLELWDGDFTSDDWKDPVKVAALQGARVVAGSLTISTTDPVALPLLELVSGDLLTGTPTDPRGPAALELPALRRVGGFLGVGTGSSAPGSSAPDLPVLTEVDGNMFAGTGSVALDLPALQQIGGNLSLGPGTATVTLDSLDKVGGELFISGDSALIAAPILRAIEGPVVTWIDARGALSLPGLQTIGGEVRVMGPIRGLHFDHLASIGGGINFDSANQATLGLVLPSLRTIGEDITLEPGLTSVELPQLTHLGGILKLFSSDRLTRIAMPKVKDITGDVRIFDATKLATIDFGALTTSGSITITNAPALTTLSVPSLDTVHRTNDIFETPGILVFQTAIDVLDLASLRSVDGSIVADSNPALQTVQMPLLTTATTIGFDSNPALDTVTAPKITALNGFFGISGSPLHTLDLRQLATAAQVSISGAALQDLSGLRSLSSVVLLELQRDNQLQDFRGLASLEHVALLSLDSNDGLTSLDGLERVTEISSEFFLVGNDALASLNGLRNVTHIGTIFMQRNNALTDIGLTGLLTIGRDLAIWDMAALTTLSGLDALGSVGGDISFIDDEGLSADQIGAFEHRLGR